MRLPALLVAMLLSVTTAHAAVTKQNYSQSDPTQNYVNMYDINGNSLDVTEGDFRQFTADGPLYYYGQGSANGWVTGTSGTPTPPFNVYKSLDGGVNWTGPYVLISPAQLAAAVGTACAPQDNTYKSCVRSHMMFNASTGKYVFTYEEYLINVVQIDVWDCDTPISGCTFVGAMGGVDASTNDQATYQDDASADAFLIFNRGDSKVYIQQLDASYHNLIGSAIIANTNAVNGEALWLQHVGSHWMVGFGSACATCSPGATPYYAVSSTGPLGTYGAQVQLGPVLGCSSQLDTVTKLVFGGVTTYLYVGDRFSGEASFGQSTPYLQPLTLTGDLFNQFVCQPSITINGVSASGPYPTPAYPRTFDVNLMQYLNAKFWDSCFGIRGTEWMMQTFVPSVATLSAVGVNLAKSTRSCGAPGLCTNLPNGSVEVDVTTVDGSNNPLATLNSVTYTAAQISGSSQFMIVPENLTLTPGTTYAVVVKGTPSATSGQYCVSRAQPGVAFYGINKYTTDSGTSWNLLTNESMQISTFPPPQPRGGNMTIH